MILHLKMGLISMVGRGEDLVAEILIFMSYAA